MTTIYAGTAVSVTSNDPPFTTADGVVTDPTTVVLKYKAGSAATVTLTFGGGEITKISTGVYTATLDTTALAGLWTVEWIGSDACGAVNAKTFQVTTPPL